MKREVLILRRAEIELNQIATWWARHRSVDQARRWLAEFSVAIDTLSTNPEQHALAQEDELFTFPLRQLLFGVSGKPTHRAIFSIEGEKVLVYTVRHLAQDVISSDDIK